MRDARMIGRHGMTVGAFLFAMSLLSLAESQTVDRVIDGDTIVVHGVGRVRLIGVDVPEVQHPRRGPSEPSGQAARTFLENWLEGRRVRLEFGPVRTDKYGRTLARVYLDGTSVTDELIRLGHGRPMHVPSPAELAARQRQSQGAYEERRRQSQRAHEERRRQPRSRSYEERRRQSQKGAALSRRVPSRSFIRVYARGRSLFSAF